MVGISNNHSTVDILSSSNTAVILSNNRTVDTLHRAVTAVDMVGVTNNRDLKSRAEEDLVWPVVQRSVWVVV